MRRQARPRSRSWQKGWCSCAFPRTVRGPDFQSGPALERRISSVLSRLGLNERGGDLVDTLSGGLKRRVELAKGLLHQPQLLLLDEPFSNVDARSARQMTHLLTQLRDAGKTIFVVTHQASQLEHAADEFVHMEAGLIARRSRGLITAETP